jgi:hypothetical protein
MRRREFISLLGGVAAWPLAAHAQQAQRMRRIGVLIGFAEADPDVQSWLAAFRGALAKVGWTEGSNFQIQLRWASDDPDRMKAFAKELVDLRPDAILSVTTPVTNAPAGEVRGRRSALSYGDYMSAGTVKPLFTFTHSFVRPEEPILSSRPDFCRARRARSVKDGA